ncbi:uncharacterized protein Z518_06721 [Rhinocladiella mackenziei CBS 650.93]|uniref:Rhinocladiella mackenziei CBS 650.93 unplaced genomic scaffold supercont1.5, whole genome shotgun sequence n=1 Tax=Rhinocladiella mackenziei CBS 650.93 TaxID=1442369 RepID=A0A0D2J2L2_9EURO|nr:uncharacterized protein Z518_06721 [Rhinocladiella mackenziei CBS 650.93]KIX03170.1 hypothetical protein Z518_06721 [Rhinocladiella mackenziei CBS 650.93]
MTELPPRDTLKRYLELYQESPLSSIFPIADPVLFPMTVERAYGQNISKSDSNVAAKACIYAFLAFTSMIENPERKLPAVDIAGCLTASSQMLLPDVLNAQASTEVIDTLIMIAVYHFCCGKIHTVDVILSLAVRFLFMLGGHLYPGEDVDKMPSESHTIDIRTALHRRDIFWICYSIDREITFRTGRPPIINDTSCDVTLPKYYLEQTTPEFAGVPRIPGDLRLSLIKSKAYEKLYSPHALRKSDAELLKDIRELDHLLETWRQSLPPKTRPTFSFSQELPNISPERDEPNIPAFLLRLEYHHCMTTIHQASSRCKNWAENQRVSEALGSSLDLALESSRSLLLYLHSSERFMMPHLFWVIIFYPVSATLTIFCNILLNPVSAAAISDLNLLRDVCKYVRLAESNKNLSGIQLGHLKQMKEFSDELEQLATSVVLQSRQDVA